MTIADYVDAFWQCFFIPAPSLTEQNLPDQAGRVFIISGGYAGCGKELSKIVYSKDGTVYLAGRSKDKAEQAIEEIKQAYPSSDGRLEFLHVDLSDLTTIKASVDTFTKQERRLDVLTNNAGVMVPPEGSKGAQGHELQMATNCLGPYLFTKLLTPLLQKTASTSPPGSVRVTWAASAATLFSPANGVVMDSTGAKVHGQNGLNYGQTKAGNVLLAKAYQAEHAGDGIVSNAWNPGNLESELQRHLPWIGKKLIGFMLYPPVYGAYTELYCGWAEEAGKEEMKGAYFGPWGRLVKLRDDVKKSPSQKAFLEWCDKETKAFA